MLHVYIKKLFRPLLAPSIFVLSAPHVITCNVLFIFTLFLKLIPV